MEKVLVEIKIPAADAKFDAFIPKTSKGIDVLNIISSTFSSMFEGKFQKASDTVICVSDTGELLDINKSIYEQNIVDGTKLILI